MKPMYMYPEYMSYRSMLNRCKDKKRYYGVNGITVCDRWKESFWNFYEDMGERPSFSHSLDRIDNSKNYSPENCRWVTKTEQMLNRKLQKNNTTGYRGVRKAKNTWEANITKNGKTEYLGRFKTAKEAAEAYNTRAKELHGVFAKLNEVE